jgi:hypothetical protein
LLHLLINTPLEDSVFQSSVRAAIALAAAAVLCHVQKLLDAAARPPASCPTAVGTAHLSQTQIPAHCRYNFQVSIIMNI